MQVAAQKWAATFENNSHRASSIQSKPALRSALSRRGHFYLAEGLKMKWEYATLTVTPQHTAYFKHEPVKEYDNVEWQFNDLINSIGADGWELATYSTYLPMEYGKEYRELVFKRPIRSKFVKMLLRS